MRSQDSFFNRSDPQRHLVGFISVVIFHAALVYVILTGLATKIIDVVRAPIETKVIEEIKKPPPPPEIIVPPPPRLEAPPPPFIPPPEVQIATPPPQQPTITATTPTPPPAPVVIAPAPPPVVVAAPAPVQAPAPAPALVPVAKPGPVAAGIACPNYKSALQAAGFPGRAVRAKLEKGEVILRFTLGPGGKPQGVTVVKQSHPIFGQAAAQVVTDEVRCDGPEGQEIITPEIVYKTE